MRQSFSCIFGADKRQQIRRLADLAVIGHQPAIAGMCKIEREERARIEAVI